MRSADLRDVAIRVRVAGTLLVLVFLLLGARAAQLALHNPDGRGTGKRQIETVLRLPPARGAILDRSGATLALTIEAPSVYAIPARIRDRRATARALARVLDDDANRIESRLGSRSPFVFVARWIDREQADAVRALDLVGVDLVEEPRRSYPHRALAGQLLGFANIDGEGVRGIERMQDTWLRGEARTVGVERDARRQILAHSGLDPRSAHGGDVLLTLDAALQADSEAALDAALAAHGARAGAVVVLDPHRGELLALAERPAFDPNEFRSTPFAQSRARSFVDAFEPGSTLKPFLVAAALERGVLAADEVIDTEGGVLRVPGGVLRDLHPEADLDVAGVLRVSSNIGAVKIGWRLGPEAHHEMLQRFGFGSRTRSGFPEESAGLLRVARSWKPLDHATISFGQGLSVTPMQLALALAALANDGVAPAPRLVAARRRPGEAWTPEPQAPGERVVSPEVANTVLGMLEGVVRGGTGRRAGLRGVRVAGKTGTAQKIDPETGAYSNSQYVSWFAGVAPADAPQLVAVVMIEEPANGHGGGAVAAPVFAAIAAGQLARAGIATAPQVAPPIARPEPAPVTEEADSEVARVEPASPPDVIIAAVPAATAPEAEAAAPTPAIAAIAAVDVASPPPTPIDRLGDRLLLPDFLGMSPEEVKRITAASSLEVEILGQGRAIAQDPAPGTVLTLRSSRIRVRFAEGPPREAAPGDRAQTPTGGGEG